jgi:hypothetical protein
MTTVHNDVISVGYSMHDVRNANHLTIRHSASQKIKVASIKFVADDFYVIWNMHPRSEDVAIWPTRQSFWVIFQRHLLQFLAETSTILNLFVVFLSHLRKLLARYRKIGHNHVLLAIARPLNPISFLHDPMLNNHYNCYIVVNSSKSVQPASNFTTFILNILQCIL